VRSPVWGPNLGVRGWTWVACRWWKPVRWARLVSGDGLTWGDVDWRVDRQVSSLPEEAVSVGSLLDAVEAEEAVVRARVEELKAQVAELTVRLEAERERLSRPMITRETAGELLAVGRFGRRVDPRRAGRTPR
jgi:hypothetical protein